MANRRVLVKRRKAVSNIHKITRTMQLIATARFQAAVKRSQAAKPFTENLKRMMENITAAAGGARHPLMAVPEVRRRAAVLVLTSNRGLCGSYNGNVARKAGEYLQAEEAAGVETEIHMVGKKGIGFMRFAGHEMAQAIDYISDIPGYDEVEPIANDMIKRFIDGEVDYVSIAYMKFLSVGRQVPVVEQILPMVADHGEEDNGGPEVDYEFSPEPQALLDELLPMTVRIRFFQCFNDAMVSEQVARMVAMTAATDAAEDVIKRLTQDYNRARQTHITMELLDIIGGANALA